MVAGEAWRDHHLVIDDGLGRPLRTDSVSSAFRALMKKNDLGGIRYHDLRHAFASALLAAKINPKIVSEALGHAKVAFTLDTYSHTIPSMGRTAADAIDEALGEALERP